MTDEELSYFKMLVRDITREVVRPQTNLSEGDKKLVVSKCMPHLTGKLCVTFKKALKEGLVVIPDRRE